MRLSTFNFQLSTANLVFFVTQSCTEDPQRATERWHGLQIRASPDRGFTDGHREKGHGLQIRASQGLLFTVYCSLFNSSTTVHIFLPILLVFLKIQLHL